MLVGGHEVRTLTLRSLRAAIGAVPQVGCWHWWRQALKAAASLSRAQQTCRVGGEVARARGNRLPLRMQDMVLFNDTILYNIHYGNLHATTEQVRAGGL